MAATQHVEPTAGTVDPALQAEVEQFLYYEAALLDDRQYDAWLDLLAEDVWYYMPTRYNRLRREMDHEFSRRDEVAHFDDDKESLRVRVKRLQTGMAWAEDPPSRTRHMVSNVRITPHGGDQVTVNLCFFVYRSRLERDVEIFVGAREDVLRRRAGKPGWEVRSRTIFLDQSVVLAKNISIFF